MVLEDVADRSRLLVEARTTLDAERLAHGDLDVVDHEAVPDRLEDAVAEAQDEHVLDGLLAQVMVDPVDLAFVEVLREELVQLPRAGSVASERLFDDQASPAAGRAVLADLHDRGLDDAGRNGEVVDAVAERAPLLVELVQHLDDRLLAALRREVRGHVAHAGLERLPDVRPERLATVLLDGGAHGLAKLRVAARRARDSDDGDLLGEIAVGGEGVEGGDELALGEVTRGAEDRDRTRLRDPADRKTGQQRILGGFVHRIRHRSSSRTRATRRPRSRSASKSPAA